MRSTTCIGCGCTEVEENLGCWHWVDLCYGSSVLVCSDACAETAQRRAQEIAQQQQAAEVAAAEAAEIAELRRSEYRSARRHYDTLRRSPVAEVRDLREHDPDSVFYQP